MKSIGKFTALCLTLLLPLSGTAEVPVNPTGPSHYTVKKGDTLWDIAGKFLQNPWQWKEVWKANPDIENPDLIYPGDVLVLTHSVDGPMITLSRNNVEMLEDGTLKIKPEIRYSEIDKPITTIPLYAINQLLDGSMVLEPGSNEKLPRVLGGTDQHVVAGVGDRIFVTGLTGSANDKFGIYRKGDSYIDPDSGEVLGYEALYLGEAILTDATDPGVVYIEKSAREILPGDILLPRAEGIITPTFKPSAPAAPVEGQILKVFDGVTLIGRDQVVVINRGANANLEVGNVLVVKQNLAPIKEPTSQRLVEVPPQTAGQVMLYRVFEQTSLGLVMSAKLPMRVLDQVTSP